MQHQDAFGNCHPLVNFTFFGLVIGFSMVLMHPVCLLISLTSAVGYHIWLHGRKSVRLLLCGALPALLLTAVINPAFNHRGSILLCYLPTGNPLTLESILYGIAAGILLSAVLLWFGCYTTVMTSDKFVYLFGRILPALSLVLSMTLRFVPQFRAQLSAVKEAQAGIGRNTTTGSLLHRLRGALACLSILITWSFEHAIETADSMKSRGYGLKGRTAFSIYRLTERDRKFLIWMGFCLLYLLCGCLSGQLFWRYFPAIRGMLLQPITVSLQVTYFALCITPLVFDIHEERVWKSLRSEI